jgi:4-carboxymuconolactone decarboxylase
VRLHDERQLPSTKQLGTLPPKSSCQRRQWLFETRTELAATMVAWDSQVSSGNYWEQPELSKRDRSLITVATLTALYRTDELRGHIRRALQNGVTKDEIRGLITHLAFYAGWPTAVNAARVALEVFEER